MGEHILIDKTAARAHFDSNVTFFCQKNYGTSFIANDFCTREIGHISRVHEKKGVSQKKLLV